MTVKHKTVFLSVIDEQAVAEAFTPLFCNQFLRWKSILPFFDDRHTASSRNLKFVFCPSILIYKSGVLRFHPATNKKQVCLEFLYFSTFSLLDSGLTRGREWQVHILFLYFLTFLWASHFSNRRLTCERWNSQLVDSHTVYKRTRYR